jgi:hypothetical protein
VQQEMRAVTRQAGTLLHDIIDDANVWLDTNPMGIATEREVSVLSKQGSVYRCVFTKATVNTQIGRIDDTIQVSQ